jgi:hypothetical protein
VGPQSTAIELFGLNRVSRLRALKTGPRSNYDLFLIDGAVDRRANASPRLADGVVVATGAALDGTPREVATRTAAAVDRFVIPVFAGGPSRFPSDTAAWIRRDGALSELPGVSWLSGDLGASAGALCTLRNDDALFLPGALTDKLAAGFLALPAETRFSLVLSDPTKVFLSERNLARIEERGIPVRVRSPVTLLAVTVNPWNPNGEDQDPAELEAAVRQALPGVPVFNVESRGYEHNGD